MSWWRRWFGPRCKMCGARISGAMCGACETWFAELAGKVASCDSGAALIARERLRQVEREGWTPEHDDQHAGEELAYAALCYAAPGSVIVPRGSKWGDPWPFCEEWDGRHRHDRIRQLTIAGALLAAEIDRLQRLYRSKSNNKEVLATSRERC